MIRNVKSEDAGAIARIYNYYVKETTVTFETEEVSTEEMKDRISKTLECGYPFIVYEEEGVITGYAYVRKWRERISYNSTLETSIYVDKDKMTKGTGKKLYNSLIEQCKKAGVHVLIGVLAHTNTASRKLHKNTGFTKTGHFKEAANKFGKFIDIEFWSLILKNAV
jgi:L-amino acid N-acyltransferase YncA